MAFRYLISLLLFLSTVNNIVYANDFAKQLAKDFSNKVCKYELPEEFGLKPPSRRLEVCYVYQNTLYVEGIISSHVVEVLRQDNSIKRVFLNSNGGSTSYALLAAELVREKGIITYVGNNNYCASSCTLVYQAGVQRLAGKTAKFLYHCVGNNGVTLTLFKQECGLDISKHNNNCQRKLNELVESSTAETKRHFEAYEFYGGIQIFELLMNQQDTESWLLKGELCKKKSIFTTNELFNHNIVTDWVDEFI